MTELLVLTLMGNDRHGLVEAVSRVIAAHGGNWEQSRMSRLAGKFAGILLVAVPDGGAPALLRSLHELEAVGLNVVVEPSTGREQAAGSIALGLELVGNDRPGIIREISQALSERCINVEELTTDCSSAPMSGDILFRARARLLVPASVNSEELRAALEALANDLMVDLTLVEAHDDNSLFPPRD